MAKIDILYLVAKTRGGRLLYYWQPSVKLKAHGWKSVPLGRAFDVAIDKARALNRQVEDWQTGGAKPREVRKIVQSGTGQLLIDRFRAEHLPKLKPNTRRDYGSKLRTLERWMGDVPLSAIDGKRVKVLRNALMAPIVDRAGGPIGRGTMRKGSTRLQLVTNRQVKYGACLAIAGAGAARGELLANVIDDQDTLFELSAPAAFAVDGADVFPAIVRHTMAHGTLRVLRTMFEFAITEEILPADARNPAADFGLGMPNPRQQVWSQAARRSMYQAAIDAGAPSMALAIELGPIIVQRPGDMLRFTLSHWGEIASYLMTDQDYRLLSALSPAGDVFGIRGRQRKTGAWVQIPVVAELRLHVETEIAKRRAAGVTSLFVDDASGLPWAGKNGQTYFQRRFREIRLAAAAAELARGDTELAAELEDLQFRDYRRTGVVVLGELGVPDHLIAALTGHTLDETKKILETYMPRNTAMAAAAVAMMVTRLPGSAERAGQERQG